MQNLTELAFPITMNGDLLLAGSTMLNLIGPNLTGTSTSCRHGQGPGYQQINPKSSQIWRGTSTDTDFLQSQTDEHQPFQAHFVMLTPEGPPMPGSLAIEGAVCWEGKEEISPPILFLILLLLVRFSKSVTLIMPLNPQPDPLSQPSFCVFALRCKHCFCLFIPY